MALLYDPGTYMPESAADFAASSWMLTWHDGPWHLHDVEVGGTVYLVRAGSTQPIVWQMAPDGFCIGWRAEPVARFDRGPQPLAEHMTPEEGDVLDLDGFQRSPHMSTAFHHRWGLPPDPDVVCTGRPPMGWFGQPR